MTEVVEGIEVAVVVVVEIVVVAITLQWDWTESTWQPDMVPEAQVQLLNMPDPHLGLVPLHNQNQQVS